MDAHERWFPGHLQEMSPAECAEQLAGHHVGRVAYCDDAGPVVVPVNYVMDGDAVLLRTSPHSTLGRHLDAVAASFQIDEYDDYTESGWSVLLRGRAHYVDAVGQASSEELTPWPDGLRTLFVRIDPHEVTGRRLIPA